MNTGQVSAAVLFARVRILPSFVSRSPIETISGSVQVWWDIFRRGRLPLRFAVNKLYSVPTGEE